jgi:signal peptidase I
VIGLPRETVEPRGASSVHDVRVPEPYLQRPPDTRPFGPVVVPVDALLVFGDNRTNSDDSRFGLGIIPGDKMIGRAFAIVWPPSRVEWTQ